MTDLPGARPRASGAPPAENNGLAIASLACGVAQFMFGPLPTIPAIVLGHVARHQIKRTGEQGAGMALAGLLLGWAALVLGCWPSSVIAGIVAATSGHRRLSRAYPVPRAARALTSAACPAGWTARR